ncbi:ubiquinone biosynthesis O-methyltransferase [Pseudovirgaria hyperparasitica]|uniref:Ubiquinone biosynthesis O-methyltransferase, mitochondrial n=1 Tax=Pseudovirgaria hyperparasitica TaxID=470096 RepID=A0A6A6VXH6_9PEZI|nr:ubiquinone biosynthesis O-methyltransferase [Pseudovirgaria hyperparasitica]KAF2754875.1 ubiquinone biosynthesis O-methyltransferase [Pseudovirgaria hyperparasitica]
MKQLRSLNFTRALRERFGHTSSQRSPALCNTSIHHPTLVRPHPYSSSAYTSIDPNEVTHFTALASSWWDPHGPSRLLHLMNPLRHTFIARCLLTSHPDPAPASLHYLDIGCGGGIFAESAARLPTTASVTGIDPTPDVLHVAQRHRRTDPKLLTPGRLTYLNKSVEQLPLPARADALFDVVSSFEVIEHVAKPAQFLEAIFPHVKPGGWVVLSTIARTWTSWLTTKLVAEDMLRIVPRGTHEWNKYINEAELREWFARQVGWEDVRCMGCMYVPGVGWKEVQGGEKIGNYFFAARKRL